MIIFRRMDVSMKLIREMCACLVHLNM